MGRTALTFVLTAALLPAGAAAARAQAVSQDAPKTAPADLQSLKRDPAFQERLRRWHEMPAARRNEMRERFEAWRKMTEKDRDRLMLNLSRFRSLPPEQQAALRKKLEQLPPEQQERLRQIAARAQSFAQMHRIPLGVFAEWMKRVPRTEMDRIRQLPPEDRCAAVRALVRRFHEHALQRFESEIPETDRESFRALPFEERVSRLRKWFAERHGSLPGPGRRMERDSKDRDGRDKWKEWKDKGGRDGHDKGHGGTSPAPTEK